MTKEELLWELMRESILAHIKNPTYENFVLRAFLTKKFREEFTK